MAANECNIWVFFKFDVSGNCHCLTMSLNIKVNTRMET